MATPSSSRDDEGVTSECPSDSGLLYTPDSKNSRKRIRDSVEDSYDDGMLWDLTEDGRPKTRRVNPQRLAIRLGPDLVAEMEAHIVPGAKMPTFAVRKDFQERYSVDRRHIYDYFHSRGKGVSLARQIYVLWLNEVAGLRVAKEDKHTNLIRGRAAKAAQAQLQAASKSADIDKEVSPSCNAPPKRPFLSKVAPSARGRPKVPKRQVKAQERKLRVKLEQSPEIPPVAIKTEPDFFIPALCGVSSENEAGPFNSSSGTETDWESSMPCPGLSVSCDTSDEKEEDTVDMSDFLTLPDDEFVSGYSELPVPALQQPFLETESSAIEMDSITAIDHGLLTEAERTELYNLIDNNIPMVLYESVGTYHSFMNEKAQAFFDHMLPMSVQSLRSRSWRMGSKSTKTLLVDSASDCPELHKWLSDDLDICQSSAIDAFELDAIHDNLDRNNALDIASGHYHGTSGGPYHV
ncbi:hypothetical protein JR316_0000428 [Psilocybe cubensis]|uniref:Uncharacterized protein n=2 Tax=Psilocybe cubensis TaxID=181762 RepID=A0A8H7Y9G9_PSICU|nr:hypothetical protein JR316_0000428 [Psilocybe cubensis]KAH9486364.1 hypothetical protein JR316_0000428 [Psilocybe cubensis]